MAVRQEKPVDVIAEELKGIAKESWLNKWARWLDQLLDTYDVEDPAEIGITDPQDLEKLEEFLVERCSGLTESECLKQIEKIIREKGYRRKVTEEVVESVMDYIKSVESKPELLYGLPSDIRAEVERYRARPELDGAKAFNLIYEYLVREGVDPEEARKVADEVAKTIPKIPPSKRVEVLEGVMKVTRLAKQRTLDYYVRRESKAKEVVKEVEKGKALSDRLVYSVIEEFNTEGKYPTLEDLRDRLRTLGYDVSNLQEVVESLKRRGMVLTVDDKLVVRYMKEAEKVGKPEVRRPPPAVRTYEERLPEHLRDIYRRWMELLRS